ncbi:class I SAM-dependent methyltransferase [Brachybacterium huguangmaarense]
MTAERVPPISRRSRPRFGTRERHRELGAAFAEQGADYDRLRPGYPAEALDAILAAAPGARDAVDLGAGTGKLAWALCARGLDVVAVDPSAAMLDALRAAAHGSVPAPTVHVGTAESTGLEPGSADIVTAAQAWHWFDAGAASAEIARILRPGGALVLVWNTLDVTIPWVHRYSRIMHAGDVLAEDFEAPPVPGFRVVARSAHRWEDVRTTHELIDLARTRSYVITAPPERREKVLANLDWYVHEHLAHAPGDHVGIPYRTDVIVLRHVEDAAAS